MKYFIWMNECSYTLQQVSPPAVWNRVFVCPLSAGVFPRCFSQRHQGLSHERHHVPDLRTLPQVLPQLLRAPAHVSRERSGMSSGTLSLDSGLIVKVANQSLESSRMMFWEFQNDRKGGSHETLLPERNTFTFGPASKAIVNQVWFSTVVREEHKSLLLGDACSYHVTTCTCICFLY